jgi:hypothetical protein
MFFLISTSPLPKWPGLDPSQDTHSLTEAIAATFWGGEGNLCAVVLKGLPIHGDNATGRAIDV